MEELEFVKCNICKFDDTMLYSLGGDVRHGIPGEFKVVKCKNCGLLYVNPRPTKESIGHYYPPNYHAYRHSTVQSILNYLNRNIVKYRIILAILETYYGYRFSKSAIKKRAFN